MTRAPRVTNLVLDVDLRCWYPEGEAYYYCTIFQTELHTELFTAASNTAILLFESGSYTTEMAIPI